MKEIKLIQECDDCGGTGLYRGMGEHDGYAVVCATCNGTGKEIFIHKYNDFVAKKRRNNITTVLECNPGISVGGTQYNFGGIPYKEWLAGGKFTRGTEMRNFTCPAWWFQTADYDKKPKWKECIGCGSFSACDHFKNKHKCWERFDKEAKK